MRGAASVWGCSASTWGTASGSSVSGALTGFSPSATPVAAAISLPTPGVPTTSLGATAAVPAGTGTASLLAGCPDSGWIGFRSSRVGSSTLTVGDNASTAALLYLTPFGAFSNAAANAVLPSSVFRSNPRIVSLSFFCPYPLMSRDFSTSSVMTPGWAGGAASCTTSCTTSGSASGATSGAASGVTSAGIPARASSIFANSFALAFSRFRMANLLPFAPLAFSASILACRSSYSACIASISGVDGRGTSGVTGVVGAASALGASVGVGITGAGGGAICSRAALRAEI